MCSTDKKSIYKTFPTSALDERDAGELGETTNWAQLLVLFFFFVPWLFYYVTKIGKTKCLDD